MATIRELKPSVTPPKALIEGLKREVYTVGTSFRQVSSESGMSVDTIKSLLQGHNCEQATVARLEAYLAALARNEFYQVRAARRLRKPLEGLDKRFWSYQAELWKVYQVSTKRLDQFQEFDRRKKLVWINHADYICKKQLMQKFKPDIERFRIWLPDAWSYFRCRHFLADKIAALAGKT